MSAHFKTILPGQLSGVDLDRMTLILGSARYAMDRALAHAERPKDFPIPATPDSLEKLLLSSVSKLKPGVRRRMSDDARERLKMAVAERVSRYGEIGRNSPGQAVDALHELKQSFSSPRFRPSAAEFEKNPLETFQVHVRAGHAAQTHERAARAPQGALPSGLEFFARQITCVDDTRELGKDEISLAGIRQEVKIDPTAGKTNASRTVIAPIPLGKFKKGDVRAVNRVLTSFDLLNTPKLCTFDLFIAETDVLKGFGHELEEARNFIPDRAFEILYSVSLSGIVLGAAPLIFPGAWPAYLILLIVIAAALLGNAIYAGLRDDVFPSQQTGIPLSAADFSFPGGALETNVETAQFSKFGGTYKLDFNWRLVV
jgi:hypothetical protein